MEWKCGLNKVRQYTMTVYSLHDLLTLILVS